MAAKVSITLYHIIPNILSGLNLHIHWQTIIIIAHKVYVSEITLDIRNKTMILTEEWTIDMFWGKVNFLFLFFFPDRPLWNSSKWNVIQQINKLAVLRALPTESKQLHVAWRDVTRRQWRHGEPSSVDLHHYTERKLRLLFSKKPVT